MFTGDGEDGWTDGRLQKAVPTMGDDSHAALKAKSGGMDEPLREKLFGDYGSTVEGSVDF